MGKLSAPCMSTVEHIVLNTSFLVFRTIEDKEEDEDEEDGMSGQPPMLDTEVVLVWIAIATKDAASNCL